MKIILIALLAISFSNVLFQKMQITISANNKSLTISPDDDNSNNLLTINSSSSSSSDNNFLTISVINEETAKDWKRSFFIYDSTGNAIKDFVLMNDGSYCIKINELFLSLQPRRDYYIYTIAIPKDPQKAMLIKPARKLVCRIKIL